MYAFDLKQALFMETGTYNDLTIRPWSTDVNQGQINQVRELTHNGQYIAPSILSGVANQILRPNAQSQTLAQIDNGWANSRLRFVFKIHEFDQMSTVSTIKMVQGYTSHMGLSHGGFLDPNMILYFNNIITLRQTFVATPTGQSYHAAVVDSDHILRGNYSPGNYGQGAMTLLMRPEDLFTIAGRTQLLGTDVMDYRVAFAEGPIKKSRRRNGSAPHYLSSVVKNYSEVGNWSDNNLELNDLMAVARGNVLEGSVELDPFLATLRNSSQLFATTGGITYQELLYILPALDHIAMIIPMRDVKKVSFGLESHRAGQTEYWTGSQIETVWSTILSQSVPSLMLDLMLSRVAINATNETLDGSVYVEIGDPCMLGENIDPTPYLEVFRNRLNNEILRGLTTNNQISFQLQMVCDVVGETRIVISVGGGPLIEYATPSCCDGLFAPVLAESQAQIESLTYNLQELATATGLESMHNQKTFQHHSTSVMPAQPFYPTPPPQYAQAPQGPQYYPQQFNTGFNHG